MPCFWARTITLMHNSIIIGTIQSAIFSAFPSYFLAQKIHAVTPIGTVILNGYFSSLIWPQLGPLFLTGLLYGAVIIRFIQFPLAGPFLLIIHYTLINCPPIWLILAGILSRNAPLGVRIAFIVVFMFVYCQCLYVVPVSHLYEPCFLVWHWPASR